MQLSDQTKGHLSAFLTISIWATTFISTKELLVEFSPLEILVFRLILAVTVLMLVSPHIIPFKSFRQEMLFLICGLCGVAFYFMFQNIALTYTLASNVAVLVSVSPFFTAILAHFFLKEEELHANFFIGFAVSIAGIILIAYNGNFILKLNPLGDILAVLCAVVWSVYSIAMRKISAFGYNTIQVTRRVFVYGFLFLIPLFQPMGFQLDLSRFASLPNLMNMAFLGIGGSALCYVTWNYAVKVLGAVKTSVYIYIIPVITIIFSALVIDEKITLVALAGVLLILSGLYLSERKPKIVKNIEKTAN